MRHLLLGCVMSLALATSALAQTPCDSTATDFFVLAPNSTGVSFFVEYPPADHAGITQYTLKLYREGQTTVLSTQVVMASSVGILGPVTGRTSFTCYSLPVVPVAQIPRGVRIVGKVTAQGAEATLASEESLASAPFGQRLPPPAVRVKP